jgi:tetratricopeptide (TPR) repeat protein
MTTKILHHQYRTCDQIYLFQSKEETLRLKVYDLSRNCLSKASVNLDFSKIQSLFKEPKATVLLSFFPEQKKIIPPTLFKDLFEEIESLIGSLKTQVPLENQQTESFTCPITYQVFKDPVIDNCGHTFEREAIVKALQNKNACPLSGQPITTLIPNLHLRQALEEWQSQDSIPTFKLFKISNPALAKGQIQMAQTYLDAGMYQEALGAYTQALQFTNNWEDYQQIPLLFQKMGLPNHAHLAALYLAKYQIQAKETEKAIQTLETLTIPDVSRSMILIHLYGVQENTEKALSLAQATAQTCHKTHPQKAILLYKYILHYSPTDWTVYTTLANILTDPQEKAHFYLKGACHAFVATQYSVAEDFCSAAETLFPNPLIDRLVHLELLSSNQPLFREKLSTLAQTYKTQNDFKQALKTYRHLVGVDKRYLSQMIKAQSLSSSPQKALLSALYWLKTLLQDNKYQLAEPLAKTTLDLLTQHSISKPAPLYNQLAILYRYQNSPQLQIVLDCLGEIYQSQGDFALAEKIYQESVQKFPTLEKTLLLAQSLAQQKDKHSEAAQTYYQVAFLALEKGDFQVSQDITEKLLHPPLLEHLQSVQKAQLLTQKHLFQITRQLDTTRAELRDTQQELQSTKRKLKNLKETQSSIINSKLDPLPEIPACAFGKAKWATHFGDIGVEPPLPSNINQILQGPCLIWPGKIVRDTHVLVLIPATVNGQPFTLKSLGELIKNPKTGPATQYRNFKLGEYQDAPVSQSYWTLMTRDVLEGSRSQNYATQQSQVTTLAQKTGISYVVPKLLETTTAILMHHVTTGQKIYSDSPYTWTRCQEKWNKDWQVVVGGFSSAGLDVGYYSDNGYVGVGCSRKF